MPAMDQANSPLVSSLSRFSLHVLTFGREASAGSNRALRDPSAKGRCAARLTESASVNRVFWEVVPKSGFEAQGRALNHLLPREARKKRQKFTTR